MLIAARDQLEEQVGMTIGVGEVADLVDDEETGAGIVAEAPAQRGIAIERGQLAEHVAGGGKQHGMAVKDRLVCDIFGDHRLAEPVGRDEDDVGDLLEEVERHQGFDRRPVAALGPRPVEVLQGLEAADMGLGQAAFESAAGAFLLLPVEQSGNPACLVGLLPMGEQAIEMQGFGAGLQGVEISPHRGSP